MTELAKTFDPAAIEARWAAHWEEHGLFRPERPDAEPFTIVNPPPNVTGALHIGHALDNTLQDVLVRYERMRGKDALWVVGTDHAGIATQMVVERQLNEKQDKRTNYSREDFVAKVWKWKAESGGQITRQLRRLGCSMDWANERFTMDEGFSKAVLKVFVDLYNQGLIYRDKRLVNWDPKLKTAISDLEVETHEVKGSFWHFRYPLADGVTTDAGADHLVVATTRPETMLADMAVAVHPDDARYTSLVGKDILQPITGRRFKVVADEHADPELGSGVVKITPGHDFNDFEVGKRAGFKPADMLNMFDAEAKVVQTADGLIPDEFIGMDRFDARKLVVARMKEAGFLIPHIDKDGGEHDAEPRTIQTPFGDRGGVVIEPWLTDQWYVDAETLAQPAIEAVKSGKTEIVPKTWEKTYFNWMENIQPWCVSRQLWWGHRIPAWYGPRIIGDFDFDKKLEEEGYIGPERPVFVASSFDEVRAHAAKIYGVSESDFYELGEGDISSNMNGCYLPLQRDLDVLDTWFSSALWPFGTLGWPESLENAVRPEPVEGLLSTSRADEEKDRASTSSARTVSGGSLLARHYPNDVLISGFDILFFWDARMMMQGLHFMGEVPFRRLYLHGLVRAKDGQKMSKSKGNVVDPLGLIDQYGADALRFFMCAMESQGRDVKMDDGRLAGYRNFATKLWNATRFAQANGIGASQSIEPPAATLPVNRWIIAETVATVRAIDTAFAELRFDAAANAIYHFTWDRFCDWYLELIKGQIDDETKAVAGWALDQILVMLHPFMPFVTEELWNALGERPYELIVAKWPVSDVATDKDAAAEIDWLIKLVSEVRGARAELQVPPSAKLDAYVRGQDAQLEEWIARSEPAIKRLARINEIFRPLHPAADGKLIGMPNHEEAPNAPSIAVHDQRAAWTLMLPSDFDIGAEVARIAKTLAAVEKEWASLDGRLSNPAFTEKAKPEAVEKAREDHAAKSAEREKLQAALARLG